MTTSPPFRPDPLRAGDGNRTHVACLEGRYSTIELHPRAKHYRGSFGTSQGVVSRSVLKDLRGSYRLGTLPRDNSGPGVGGAGFEPAKVEPPDLQSGPFSHLGIHPRVCPSVGPVLCSLSKFHPLQRWAVFTSLSNETELAVRVELTTVGLQNRCSAN